MRKAFLARRDRVLSSVAHVGTHVPVGVALTFDDGPVPGTTDLVLDALAVLDAPATFFCVGRNATRHPRLLQRMLDEGHAVGSHSLSHDAPGALSAKALAVDYASGRQAVEDAIGRPVPLFRPPYGRLDPATVRTMRSCRTWTWSVDPGDWLEGATTDGLVAALRPTVDRDVVLLHDWLEPQVSWSTDRSATIGAVRHLVASLRARSIPLVTLGG